MNRAIRERDLDAIYVTGPGHGGPGLVANAYLEGTYSEVYPHIGEDEEGMRRLFRQFSFPGGIPSHVAPETPGSIHEGGELGYALVHAYGAVFDNPDLLALCVVGDGEAETGPLAASWHSNKFVNPARDGAVLPVLHLNGYKIANPTVLARIGEDELRSLLEGYGHSPRFVEGDDPADRAPGAGGDPRRGPRRDRRHPGARASGRPGAPALADDRAAHARRAGRARRRSTACRPRARSARTRCRSPSWPTTPSTCASSSAGCAPTGPRSCSTTPARLREELRALRPEGERRMGANPHANGGSLLRDLELPDFRDYAVAVDQPGDRVDRGHARPGRLAARRHARESSPPPTSASSAPTRPPRTGSARLFEETDRAWMADRRDGDDHLSPDGRVMEILSEHLCQGWLEGYLLTGRHGLFNCYEAFIHIVDSMFNQHAKWLKVTRDDPLAQADRVAQLPALVARLAPGPQRLLAPGPRLHRPRREQEGRDRPRLPAAGRELPAVGRRPLPALARLRERDRRGQAAVARLPVDGRRHHALHPRDRHLGMGLQRATASEPDVVLACAGDIPTLETLAAAALLREHLPDLRVRVVNVVDLMRLQPESEHPHGLPDAEFDALFTTSQPVIFAYHGYPWLIHRLTYRRTNHHNLHVRGYKEEGTTTTPFDMVMLNDLDRFHLVMDVIDRVPHLGETAAGAAPADGGRAPAPPRTTRASTATTRRTCATGPGPAECASSSPTPGRAASSCRCSTPTTPSCGGASSTLRGRSWSRRRCAGPRRAARAS